MKTVYLVRHAKSDKDNSNLVDIDRPLNSRGYREAYEMGQFLGQKKISPELLITSPAIRTYSTALIFCRHINLDVSKIVLEPDLYESTVKHYLQVIQNTDNNFKSIMIFGHNPTITDVTNDLTSSVFENIPPCGVIGISSNAASWKKFGSEPGKLLFSYFPEKNATAKDK